MRERFSALIRKPVYTFKFDRFRTVTPDTYRKLVRARNSRAIVVTTPVDVKAFFLKYVEIIHTLDRAHARAAALVDVGALRNQAKICVRILELFFAGIPLPEILLLSLSCCSRRRQTSLEYQPEPRTSLWRTLSGALLMDEVDLVLHPLKSELNFPIGDKEPLDLTRSSAGKGVRWDIPLHLLDALFHAAEGSM